MIQEAGPFAVTIPPLPPPFEMSRYELSGELLSVSRNQQAMVEYSTTQTLLSASNLHSNNNNNNNKESKQVVLADSIEERMVLPNRKRARPSSHDEDDSNQSVPTLSFSLQYARQRGIRMDHTPMDKTSLPPPYKRMTLPVARKRTVLTNQRSTGRYLIQDTNKRKEREELLIQEFSRKKPKLTGDHPTLPFHSSTTKTIVTTSTVRKDDSKPFSFGSALADADNNNDSTIVPFGSTGIAPEDSKPVTTDTRSKPAFSFGATTTSTRETTEPNSHSNKPAFSFGSKQLSEGTASQSNTPTLFSFGTTAAPPSFGTSATTPAVVGGGAASQRRRAAKSRRKAMA